MIKIEDLAEKIYTGKAQLEFKDGVLLKAKLVDKLIYQRKRDLKGSAS